MREKLLTIREAAHYLGISEKQIIELSEQGLIPAYKIGGAYLRFKKVQLELVKDKLGSTKESQELQYSFIERANDFLYYNDFYILSVLIISFLVYFIFHL